MSLDTQTFNQILKERKDPFNVLKSTRYVVETAKQVSIHSQKLDDLSQLVKDKIDKNDVLTQERFGDLFLTPQKVFLEDVVNFCFWTIPNKEKWHIEYPQDRIVDGWDALIACFDRAIDEKVPILDAEYLETISKKDIVYIFRGRHSTKLSQLDTRRTFLQEAGKVLCKEFDGSVDVFLKHASYDAVKIVKSILKHFASFRDYAMYKDREIALLKRAQITAFDISLLPNIQMKNIDQLTIFADYKLPQILRGFGILKYHKELTKKVDSYTILEKDSPEEIEIRSATIWACELIAHKIGEKPVTVDNALWHLSHEMDKKLAPNHRVLTCYY